MGDDDARAAIAAVLREHDRAFSALDFDAVSALWDDEDDDVVYHGEEYPRPQAGWHQLIAHWARLGARLQAADVSTEPTIIRSLSGDLALAVLLIEWRLVGVDSDVEHVGTCWATSLLRRRSGRGWRLFHYMEAPIHLDGAPSE